MENITLREWRALRKSTDHLPIAGIDAMFIASLQLKLENKVKEVELEESKPAIKVKPKK
tara:strand:- start:2074 stop:2250 length:177 start_codon:yes stop_codon:yes gene_type:complete